jgi:hypothetical protein
MEGMDMGGMDMSGMDMAAPAAPVTPMPPATAPLGGAAAPVVSADGNSSTFNLTGITVDDNGQVLTSLGVIAPVSSTTAPVVTSAPAVAPASTDALGGAASLAASGSAGTAAQTLDPRIVTGTPASGGMLANILAKATPDVGAPLSEGKYMWVMEGDAGLYLHVHGTYWQQHPDEIRAAVSDGRLMVHYHADGTLHLHDMS